MNNSFLNGKTLFISGGTGSFGNEFLNLLIKKFKTKKIIIYSRDELKQYEMSKRINPSLLKKIRFFIGDVRDLERLKLAMEGVDIVIHAAALKQVPTAEYNPFEAVKTNIIGAQNIIEASIYRNVDKVLALSTDKAAAPINLYGATKLASDKLFLSANNIRGNKKIKFSVVRYGNVMFSRGSVVPFFIEQKKRGVIPITDKEMTRFNITLKEGAEFVLKSLRIMSGGELFVPKIPSMRIIDLANAIAPNAKKKIVGIRPGEKIHEEMITETDSLTTYEFKEYYAIISDYGLNNLNNKNLNKLMISKGGKKCEKGFKYNSKNNKKFLTISQIKNLLKLK